MRSSEGTGEWHITQYKKPDQKALNGEFNAIHAQNSLSSIHEYNEIIEEMEEMKKSLHWI